MIAMAMCRCSMVPPPKSAPRSLPMAQKPRFYLPALNFVVESRNWSLTWRQWHVKQKRTLLQLASCRSHCKRKGFDLHSWQRVVFQKVRLDLCCCQNDPESEQTDETGSSKQVSRLEDGDGEGDGDPEKRYTVGSSQVASFSRLPSKVPWGGGLVAATMVIYWCGFHIPIGLGGLASVASILPQQSLDPQAQAVSVVVVQLLELAGTVWLVQSTLQPFKPLPGFFNISFSSVWRERGWLPASALGLVVLLLAVGVTASLTQRLSPSEVDNTPSAYADLLTSTTLARVAMYVAYCGITPCLEEYVYRGFLLPSLGSYMRWPLAVILSALVFALSHFSLPGFLSLFWVGCCLGTAYTWTGNLVTPFMMHSLYNAIVLTKALLL